MIARIGLKGYYVEVIIPLIDYMPLFKGIIGHLMVFGEEWFVHSNSKN